MRAGPGLSQLELRAAAHDLAAKFDKSFEHLLERQHARLAVDDRDVDDAERRLHRRQLVKLVENDLRHGVAFELDDDAHALAVRFVAQLGNAVESSFR